MSVIVYAILFGVIAFFCFYLYRVARVQNHPTTYMRAVLHRLALSGSFNYIDDENRAPTELSRRHANAEAGLLEFRSEEHSVYGTFIRDDVQREVDFVVSGATLPIDDSVLVLRGERPFEISAETAKSLNELTISPEDGQSLSIRTNSPAVAEQVFAHRQRAELEDFERHYERSVTVEIADDQLFLRVPVQLEDARLDSVCADAMQLGLTLRQGVTKALTESRHLQ